MSNRTCAIYLLGPPRAQVDGKLPALRRKTRAILAYLAASSRAYPRRALYDLFCQEAKDPAGTLRWYLSRIRRQLGSEILLMSGDSVQFNHQFAWVDSEAFENALSGDLSRKDLKALIAAADGYRGEFLAGLELPDAPEFELWLLGERARLRQLYERGLAEVVARLIAQERYEDALRWAQRLVQSNPILEEAHARLIWLYAQTGQREAALQQFERCRELLRQELAVEPTPELMALRSEVLAGRLGRPLPRRVSVVDSVADVKEPIGFVGRGSELAQLGRAWEGAYQGRGAVVLLESEAGGGKTRLVHELSDALSDALFLVGACYESSRTLPYRPWIELLEMRLAGLDTATLDQFPPFWLSYMMRLLPTLAGRLGRDLPPTPPTSGGELDRLFTAVSEFLFRLPATPPLLIFIDNLQWADEASLRLFHFLSRRVPQVRALLIGAFRTEEAGDVPALQTLLGDLSRDELMRLFLPPLTLESITALTTQLWPRLPEGYRPHVCAMLAQATNGNPLFVTEVLRELGHTTEAPVTLPVPKGVRELIHRRLGRLSGSSRQVIEAAAVLDAPVTLDEAQQISARSEDETIKALDLGLRRGMLKAHSGGYPIRYDFGHDLVREAVVSQLSDVRRRLLHRRAANTLEGAGARPAALARHWALAGDPGKEGQYAALAGERAADVYANEEATRYLERALQLITDSERRLELLVALGDVRHLTGKWNEADSVYRQALELTGGVSDPAAQALCLNRLGHLLVYRGAYAEALNYLEQAQIVCEKMGNQPDLLGQVIGEMGIACWYQGDYPRALNYLERRLQIAREMGDQRGASIAIANMGIVYWSQGDHARAMACYEQKLRYDEKVGDRLSMSKALGNMGIVYRDQGDLVRALTYLGRKLQIDAELGDRLGVSLALDNMGEAYRRQGEHAQALNCFEQALQIATDLGNWQGVSVTLGNMVKVLLAQGRHRLAEQLSRPAVTLGRALNVPRNLCSYLYDAAILSFIQRRYDRARLLNDEALHLAIQVENQEIQFSAQVLSVRLRVALGNTDVPGAMDEFKTLLDEWPGEQEQGAIYYEAWRLDKTHAAYRQTAAALYRDLYSRTPRIEYQQRYKELTGKRLTDPTPLPELPASFPRNPLDLDGLLARVDQAVSEIV